MPTISVLSWNIREFGKKSTTKTPAQIRARVGRVANHIRDQDPDVFGLLEVENIDILSLIEGEFPDYNFSLTDGPKNNKEILVGHRQGRFDQIAFSQKRQFDLHNPYLRPGALFSGRLATQWYNILFLHTDSGTEARDFGNRYEMFDKVWGLRKSLDKKDQDQRENFVVMGDLNTMGLKYPRQIKRHNLVVQAGEVEALDEFARANQMVVQPKSHDETYKKPGRSLRGNLDHAITSDHLRLVDLGTRSDGTAYTVEVIGWNDLSKTKREKFLNEMSDHSSLYLEVAV